MRTLLFLTLLLATPVVVATQPQVTDLRTKLDNRVTEYTVSAASLVDALSRTAKEFQLPMGIEWVKDEQALVGLNRTWTNEKVGQILRSIVETYPGYSYEIEEGVVHVFRRDLLKDSRNFLNLKVPDFFEVRHETGGFANQQLQSLVQNIVSPRNLVPGAGEAGSYATGMREKALNLNFHGSTVREALEKLASASEHKIWLVTFSDTSKLTQTGFYRTETLWHPSPFPNTQQPMWDFLAWTEYRARPTDGLIG